MKKLGLGVFIGVVLVFSGIAVAKALVFLPAEVAPSGVAVKVPDVAIGKSPVLEGLEPGTLERAVFIHYASGKVTAKAKTPNCYKLYGIKWKTLPVNYVVSPGVEAVVPGAVFAGNETWDAATSKELFNNSYALDSSADWDSVSPDGRNEYSSGNYYEDGVIAVTVLWSGVPIGGKGMQIIEYDVMFDTDYIWGNAENSSSTVMDLQNIAIHESGHGVGLADVYDLKCSAVTMYGYSGYGELSKRTLEKPDITGLRKLYGF